MRDLVTELRNAASEIANAGHDGWGNICSDAADALERHHEFVERDSVLEEAAIIAESIDDARSDLGGVMAAASIRAAKRRSR